MYGAWWVWVVIYVSGIGSFMFSKSIFAPWTYPVKERERPFIPMFSVIKLGIAPYIFMVKKSVKLRIKVALISRGERLKDMVCPHHSVIVNLLKKSEDVFAAGINLPRKLR